MNLIDLFKATDEVTRNEGLNWYRDCRAFCEGLAVEFNQPLPKVVGLFSALSPGTSYEQNKRDARRLLQGSRTKFTTYKQNVKKAKAILASDQDPTTFFSDKTGPKTRNFYLNILDPDGFTAVTIDRHAYRIATNLEYKGLRAKQYKEIADLYRAAAAILGLRPLELQAVLWVDYRKRNDIQQKNNAPF